MKSKIIHSVLLLFVLQINSYTQKPRARDIGIPFDGTTGKFNAITDVKGVEVGYSTIISGQGNNIRGKGPVRTGVTAILPRGRNNNPVFSNWYSLNGNGEMTGTTWITESGFFGRPHHDYQYQQRRCGKGCCIKMVCKEGLVQRRFLVHLPGCSRNLRWFFK